MESEEELKISVIGLGFVGLTSALGFADKGFMVTGYDINSERMDKINNGEIPFFEPGLDTALSRTLGNTFMTSKHAAADADCVFFCVGTPCGSDGKADLKYLFSAFDSVIDIVKPDCMLVIKSTVPPGTTQNVIMPYIRAKGFHGPVTVNPEFLREGLSWNDFVFADRIVCGCDECDTKAIELLTEVYQPFHVPVHFVSPNTAEFIKYLSNSLLATLISFSNEMAQIAEATGGINISEAFKILHEDKRLAGAGISHYIYPGCGYGGYCLPKDTVALAAHAKANGLESKILENVISLNDNMPHLTTDKIERAAGGKDEKIGVLGLSFKPGSDDVRYSSAAKIIEGLLADGYHNIYAYDPVAAREFDKMYQLKINYLDSKEAVCETCGTVAVVTAWKEFVGIDKEFPDKRIVDCRYCL